MVKTSPGACLALVGALPERLDLRGKTPGAGEALETEVQGVECERRQGAVR